MNQVRRRAHAYVPALSRCALAIAMVAAGAAQAQDGGPSFRFSGYGTVGVAHSSESQADFVSGGDQPSGAGHTRSWSFDPDTKVGVQVDGKFGPRFSATAQVIARQRYDNSYTPDLMMAFGKWQASSEISLRAGRLLYPVFLISDYRTVGYSQTTLRPPVDLYNIFAPYHFDGADLTWATNAGGLALRSQLFGGSSKTRSPGDTTIESKSILGLSVSAEAGDLTVRAAYMTNKVSVSSPDLDGAFMAVRYGLPPSALYPGSPAIPGDAALADQYAISGTRSSYASVGVNYDPGAWFVTAEVSDVSAVGFSGRKALGYLTVGARHGAFTPYATISRLKATIAGTTTNNPILDGVRASTAAASRSSLSAGLRWDAMKNVALKAQYDHVRLDEGSHGALINLQPAFQPGGSYNVISAAVDFVF